MNKSVKLIAVTTFLSFVSFNVLAGSGKATLPHWGSPEAANLFISNITPNHINVNVTFYDKAGNKLPPTTIGNFVNSNSQLAPNSTGFVAISTSSFDYGYATIEWTNEQGDDDVVALIAHGYRVIKNTSSLRSDIAVPVNNGMPF